METRALKHFLTLAECLHFGRAAETSHISPSTLSRSIQRLEETVGVPLFERNNRRVSLTHAGRLFLDYAREAANDWDAIRNRLMEQSGELHGEVSIYCSVTASYSFLFEILSRFRTEHPGVEIKLHTGDPEEAVGRVMSGAEDVAIGARPARLPPALAFRRITVSPLVFIAGVDSRYGRLRSRTRARPDDWAGVPMILPERGEARDRADRWLRRLGVVPRIYAQVAGNEAIVSMVSLGFGVGVVPRIVLENSPLAATVRTLEVHPALPPYEVGLLTQRRRLAGPLIEALWSVRQD